MGGYKRYLDAQLATGKIRKDEVTKRWWRSKPGPRKMLSPKDSDKPPHCAAFKIAIQAECRNNLTEIS